MGIKTIENVFPTVFGNFKRDKIEGYCMTASRQRKQEGDDAN
jgi:hypothetical protein